MRELIERHHALARRTLAPAAYSYYAGGSGEGLALTEAAAAWARYRLRPHVLRDVSRVDTSTTLLGTDLRLPVLVAPTAFQVMAHQAGECATAEGAARAGSLMVVSARSTRRLEDIAAVGAPWWFQLYVMRDRSLSTHLADRAVAAGATALVFTVDTPYVGRREQPTGPLPITDSQYLANLAGRVPPGTPGRDLAPDGDPRSAVAHAPSISLDTLRDLVADYDVPVLVKGVLRADDALACLGAGAAGVIVSNHGGRQLDRAIDTATALAEVATAVAGRARVLVDGGLRCGADVLTALALGAEAVLLGRPVLWALAAEGSDGVANLLTAMRDDLAHVLALAGVTSARAVPSDLVAAPDRGGVSGLA